MDHRLFDGVSEARLLLWLQKSRITYVDGIPVLRNNMYDINQGEPSVFQEVAEKKKQRKRKCVQHLRFGSLCLTCAACNLNSLWVGKEPFVGLILLHCEWYRSEEVVGLSKCRERS